MKRAALLLMEGTPLASSLQGLSPAREPLLLLLLLGLSL